MARVRMEYLKNHRNLKDRAYKNNSLTLILEILTTGFLAELGVRFTGIQGTGTNFLQSVWQIARQSI